MAPFRSLKRINKSDRSAKKRLRESATDALQMSSSKADERPTAEASSSSPVVQKAIIPSASEALPSPVPQTIFIKPAPTRKVEELPIQLQLPTQAPPQIQPPITEIVNLELSLGGRSEERRSAPGSGHTSDGRKGPVDTAIDKGDSVDAPESEGIGQPHVSRGEGVPGEFILQPRTSEISSPLNIQDFINADSSAENPPPEDEINIPRVDIQDPRVDTSLHRVDNEQPRVDTQLPAYSCPPQGENENIFAGREEVPQDSQPRESVYRDLSSLSGFDSAAIGDFGQGYAGLEHHAEHRAQEDQIFFTMGQASVPPPGAWNMPLTLVGQVEELVRQCNQSIGQINEERRLTLVEKQANPSLETRLPSIETKLISIESRMLEVLKTRDDTPKSTATGSVGARSVMNSNVPGIALLAARGHLSMEVFEDPLVVIQLGDYLEELKMIVRSSRSRDGAAASGNPRL